MNIEISIGAVLFATLAQFVVGAIWYMPIFGQIWGQIHGFDKKSAKEQKEAQKQMAPFMLVQLLITLLTSYVLAHVIKAMPDESAYSLALWMWIGFVVPTQIAAVVFGGTEPKWMIKKSVIMAGGSLACLIVATTILK